MNLVEMHRTLSEMAGGDDDAVQNAIIQMIQRPPPFVNRSYLNRRLSLQGRMAARGEGRRRTRERVVGAELVRRKTPDPLDEALTAELMTMIEDHLPTSLHREVFRAQLTLEDSRLAAGSLGMALSTYKELLDTVRQVALFVYAV